MEGRGRRERDREMLLLMHMLKVEQKRKFGLTFITNVNFKMPWKDRNFSESGDFIREYSIIWSN